MSRYRLSAFLAVPVLMLTSFAFAKQSAAATPALAADSAAVLETKMALHDLSVEHVFWIRRYVLAAHAGDEVQSKIAEKEVVANAKTLADTIAPIYGPPAADALLILLAGHWGWPHGLKAGEAPTRFLDGREMCAAALKQEQT